MRRRGPGLPGQAQAFDALPGASASDNCDDNLTYACTTGPLTGGACGGTITREHTVTDDCGNDSSCQQTITVDDNTLPVITCPDNITVECEDEVPACPESFAAFDALPGASASDNWRRQPDLRLHDGPADGRRLRRHDHAGTQRTDDCGNTKTRNQTITVTTTPCRRSPARTTSRWAGAGLPGHRGV
ncbi:MAG: hypothetical protein IPH12_01175 [Saprospirales bacterium]|nr:hypothetical protein [Saprospirales bacterium]